MFCHSPKLKKPWTYLKLNRKYLFHLYSPHSYLLQFTSTCSQSLTLNLEYMHACAAKVIHRLPWDTQDVLSLTVWDSYLNMYETG